MRFGIHRRRRRGRGGEQLELERLSDAAGDLAMDGQHIGGVALITLSPERSVVPGAEKLRIDAHTPVGAADAAFEDVVHTKLPCDLVRRLLGALVLHRGAPLDRKSTRLNS